MCRSSSDPQRRSVTDEESGIDELVLLSPRFTVDHAARSVMPDCEAEVSA